MFNKPSSFPDHITFNEFVKSHFWNFITDDTRSNICNKHYLYNSTVKITMLCAICNKYSVIMINTLLF